MTTEEKAKAYDEAIERAKGLQHENAWVTTIFPELAMGEDEKIIQELIDYLNPDIPFKTASIDTVNRWLAYLEKQKEQKWSPSEGEMGVLYKLCYISNQITDEDDTELTRLYQDLKREYFNGHSFENMFLNEKQTEQKPAERQDYSGLNDLERAIHRGFLSAGVENVSVKIIKETAQDCLAQIDKSAEWSEEYREEDLRMRFAFYTYKDEDSALYLSNVFVEETSRNKGFGTKILAAAEKVAETLGAIQIRLKVKQNSPANAWYRKHGYGYIAFEDGYDWLEKTLEYMKPIKPAEWGNEDEEMLDAMIDIVSNSLYEPLCPREGMLAWLKSLKNRGNSPKSNTNSPSWKPSGEHFQGLRRALKYVKQGSDTWNSLTDLYEHLKKLL